MERVEWVEPEPATAAVAGLFEEIDVDGDGFITKAELSSFTERHIIPEPSSQTAATPPPPPLAPQQQTPPPAAALTKSTVEILNFEQLQARYSKTRQAEPQQGPLSSLSTLAGMPAAATSSVAATMDDGAYHVGQPVETEWRGEWRQARVSKYNSETSRSENLLNL